jgi:sialate O-acetylesterase
MKFLVVIILSLLISSLGYADVKLPAVFSSNMVLQREIHLPVWGWADPGEEVTVAFADQQSSTQAGDDGKRLALWALARDYGKKDIVYSGPLYKSMSVEGDKIRIRFDHLGPDLGSRDGKLLSCFSIAGADRKFVDAVAEIDGNTVLVSSVSVTNPVAVRFG